MMTQINFLRCRTDSICSTHIPDRLSDIKSRSHLKKTPDFLSRLDVNVLNIKYNILSIVVILFQQT